MDPIASLAPFDIEYTIGDRDFVLAARPASVWLKVLLPDQVPLESILPGWTGGGARRHIFWSLARGELTHGDWNDMAMEILEQAAGRKWWQAVNLIVGMKDADNWTTIFGGLMLRGVDADTISLAAWLDAAMALCTEHMDKEERIKFRLTIDTPPVGTDPAKAIDAAEQERAFLALMQSVNG
jgi:hypothetical protein